MKELSTQIKLKNGNLKTIYVEIEDEIAEFLKSKTKEEIHNFIVFEYESKLTERKETRRHTSANMLYEKGVDFEDYNQDTDSVLDSEKEYNRDLQLEKLQKKVFAKYLTERQAEAFYQFVILKYNKIKIAKNMEITESAVRKLIDKATLIMREPAYKTLRYFLGDDAEIEEYDILADEMVYSADYHLNYLLQLK